MSQSASKQQSSEYNLGHQDGLAGRTNVRKNSPQYNSGYVAAELEKLQNPAQHQADLDTFEV